jgi:hypothetical protein
MKIAFFENDKKKIGSRHLHDMFAKHRHNSLIH